MFENMVHDFHHKEVVLGIFSKFHVLTNHKENVQEQLSLKQGYNLLMKLGGLLRGYGRSCVNEMTKIGKSVRYGTQC